MKEKRAHFIGIAGMGMSAVALILKSQGWHISGSDAESYPPGTTQLARHGISFNSSYSADNNPKDAEVIVIGMNAKLTRENNAEVRAAYESGVRTQSFPELLGETVKDRSPIVITGSYGKSTVTSLLAWCLSQNKVDAGWFIGGAPIGMDPSHLGTHLVFVLEGDEYPTSRADPRPKFAHYHAHDALVNAASHDHVNVYKTQEEFLKPFQELAASLPKGGFLFLCADEPHAASLAQHTHARVVTYGLHSGNWHAEHIVHAETTSFDLLRREEKVATLSTSLLGDHNIANIVGASAVLLEKKLLSPEALAAAIKSFKGLARRLDVKTTRSSVPAHEGFGSSREKLQSAISAMKSRYPDKRLVVVFEPHTFSWRNKHMLHWFDTAFAGADFVVLYKPAEQGADTHEQSTQEDMVARLKKVGVTVIPAKTPKEVLNILKEGVRDGDVVLLSSSGAMDGLIEKIPEWLDNTFST